jgi:hypothetical protein
VSGSTLEPLRPTWLEIASGRVVGEYHGSLPPLGGQPRRSPVEALEHAMLPALERPPCMIGFTGGRDSSGILGVAIRLARREGLPEPIPLTLRFPGIPSADESSWQALMLRHAGVESWERVEIDTEGGELDLLGEKSRSLIERVGLLWPPNVLIFSRIFEAAAELGARSAMTGLEADGLFGRWQWSRLADVLARRARPRPSDLLHAVRAAGPRALRQAVAAHSMWTPSWLRAEPRRHFMEMQASEVAGAPRRWDRWVRWWWRRRYVAVLRWSLGRITGDLLAVNPYMDAGFVDALGRDGGPTGYGDRNAIMEAVFGGLLPKATVHRKTKAATFSQLCWSDQTREFVAGWDGSGLEEDLIDVEALRANWLSDWPDERSALLLLTAWLAQRAPSERPSPVGAPA